MLNSLFARPGFRIATLILLVVSVTGGVRAQSLNWEGQVGGVMTPFAYVVESKDAGISLPAAAFHLLSGGDVVGTHYYGSLTVGFLNRAEVGYSRAAITTAAEEDSHPLTSLFDRGFNIIHGKVILLKEDSSGLSLPAISAGFVTRFQQEHIEGGLGSATKNGDIYVVVTKTSDLIQFAPVVLSGGVKVTNASLMGLAGNAPEWAWRGFVFGGINLGSRLLLGAEFMQQPEQIEFLAGADLPATISFLARLVPDPKSRLSIDAAVIRAGDEIGDDLNIKADNRFSFGLSYRF